MPGVVDSQNRIGKMMNEAERKKKLTQEEADEKARQEAEKAAAELRAKYFEGINLEEAYLGKDFQLNDKIKIHLPTVEEIIQFDPQRFWNFLTTFCANPTAVRGMLWKLNMEWFRMTDFQLFILMVKSFHPKDTKIFFGDLDFTKFEAMEIITNLDQVIEQQAEPVKETILVHTEIEDLFIDEVTYNRMVNYLRAIFDYHPKVEKPRTKLAIRWMLEQDEEKIKQAQREAKLHPTNTSYLLPLLSFFFKAYPGFRPEDMSQINYFFFMDSIRRAQDYENSVALMHGVYGGFLDMSNTKNKKLKKEMILTKNLY